MMEQLKSMLTIRGDSLYCPLSFSLDTYGNCEIDCYHCYHRRLNYIWGTELKPMDLEIFEKKITNGLKNKNPRSSLAWALKRFQSLFCWILVLDTETIIILLIKMKIKSSKSFPIP